MRDDRLSEAWTAGGGSYEALRRYGEVAGRVAAKYSAAREGRPGAELPSDAELLELRERFVEHTALSEHANKLLTPSASPSAVLALVLYRLTLFAAAIAVLWDQFASRWPLQQ